MSKTSLLYVAVFSFFIGVAVRSLISLDTATFLFVLLVAAALGVYWYIDRSGLVVIVAVALLMFSLGAGRFGYAEHRIKQAQDTLEARGHEVLSGVVVGEVIEEETTRRFTVETNETRVAVTADRYPTVQYGDTVVLTGDVELPEAFETDTGRIFDYPSYLAARGVTHRMYRPEIEIQGSGGGFAITRNLFRLKEAFLSQVHSVVPEPHTSLLGGLVVGAQEAMGEDLIEAFRLTGLIHIVVLSGYNVTIVAESIMRALGFLSRRVRMIFGATGIILFAILTGATATIVRASIMALLVILAQATGRTYEIVRALVVTALVMVLYNPYVLMFDPSFQLSFLATLGLIFVVPLLERLFWWLKHTPALQSFVLATVATQLFVLPLLLYQVGMLSVVAVPVNILVLPVVPTVMLFGFLTGVLGFLSGVLAVPFAFLSYLLLSYILKVVEWFAALPFAAVSVPAISGWVVLLLYGCYALVLFLLFRHTKQPQSSPTLGLLESTES